MATKVTTGHWQSKAEVRNYHRQDTDTMLAEGLAVVGRPVVPPGDCLLVTKYGQYVIETGART